MPAEPLATWIGRAAVRHLGGDRARGFPRAAHRMIFLHRKGFTGRTELQRGDVFARAIIADALCDLRDAGAAQLSAILSCECAYLVSRRQRSGCGGWSYFPELPELPPDVDVLAEIMQVLIRCGRWKDLRTYAEPPLRTVLRDAVRRSGAVGTWIIPGKTQSPLEQRQAHFVKRAWGDTDDVEVTANFLFALALYDGDRFASVIKGGARFLQDRQEPDGWWRSTWYVGPYYGTYVCCRALAASRQRMALERARDYLLKTQRPDGGWGRGLLCCQLGTALALCALGVIADVLGTREPDQNRMNHGIHALAGAYDLSGGWHSPPFIRMDIGRPRGENGQELLYCSSSITAAYALKAIIAFGKPAARRFAA